MQCVTVKYSLRYREKEFGSFAEPLLVTSVDTFDTVWKAFETRLPPKQGRKKSESERDYKRRVRAIWRAHSFLCGKDAVVVGSVQFEHGENTLEIASDDTLTAFRAMQGATLKVALDIKASVDRGVDEKLKKALLARDPAGYTEVTATQATSADNVQETLSEGITTALEICVTGSRRPLSLDGLGIVVGHGVVTCSCKKKIPSHVGKLSSTDAFLRHATSCKTLKKKLDHPDELKQAPRQRAPRKTAAKPASKPAPKAASAAAPEEPEEPAAPEAPAPALTPEQQELLEFGNPAKRQRTG